MVEKDSENFYSKYLRISLPFLVLIFLSFSVFALTTTDKNYSSGIYNGDFELGTGSSNGKASWVGDSNYGWLYDRLSGTNSYASFDSSIKHSGNSSIRLDSNGDLVARTRFSNDTDQTSLTISFSGKPFYKYPVKPSTKYKLSAWLKGQDCNGDSSCGLFYESRTIAYSDSGVLSGLTYLPDGNSDWTYKEIIFTSNALTAYVSIQVRINVAGKDTKLWVDDVRLEEVGSVNLSGQLQGRPSIVVTGVSDNAIDQADTNNSNTKRLGNGTSNFQVAQTFTPTKNRFSGVIFQRNYNTGTFTGDVNISLFATDGVLPIGDALSVKQYTNAQWEALPLNVDVTAYFPYNIDANGTNKYAIVFTPSTNDVNNYTRIKIDSTIGGSYSGGNVLDRNSTSWVTSNDDLYFKTLFEKQSSAFDLNVCSALGGVGDSVCESKTYDIDFLENGENYLINPADAPLFYEGDNNVYFMMHSDSDYNNTTPSMMAKLTYTFDKPTTTLSRAKGTVDNTENITLTCTNGTTGNCNQTYYSFNGTTYYTYNTPFVLNNGTYNIRYYSTADNNNTETINTSSFTVPIQGSTATCSIAGLFPLLLIAFGITALGGLFFTKQFLDTGDMKYMINFILMLIIGVLIIITIAPILC
jgi:hypothetical protein